MTTTETKETMWLTKAESAAMLGESTRAIERKAAAGKIKTKSAARAGKRPATLYAADDVERIRTEMQQSHRGPSELATIPPETRSPQSEFAVQMANLATLTLTALRAPAQPTGARRRWLTLEEASLESGLSKRFLRKLCRAGELRYVWDEQQPKIANDSLNQWEPGAVVENSAQTTA